MSGGSHDYAYTKLEDIANSFSPQEPTHKEERQKIGVILRHMAKICHDVEWIDSCDYGEEDWIEVKKMLDKINLENK